MPLIHLSLKELACKDGSPYPYKDGRLDKLSFAFETIRAVWNKPITILSAYRTTEYNAKIGGARYSQHILGKALDLRPPVGITLKEFYDHIKSNYKKAGIGGIGYYPEHNFIHIDIRPLKANGFFASWSGSNVKDSDTKIAKV